MIRGSRGQDAIPITGGPPVTHGRRYFMGQEAARLEIETDISAALWPRFYNFSLYIRLYILISNGRSPWIGPRELIRWREGGEKCMGWLSMYAWNVSVFFFPFFFFKLYLALF